LFCEAQFENYNLITKLPSLDWYHPPPYLAF
jgi:hypothetical protein